MVNSHIPFRYLLVSALKEHRIRVIGYSRWRQRLNNSAKEWIFSFVPKLGFSKSWVRKSWDCLTTNHTLSPTIWMDILPLLFYSSPIYCFFPGLLFYGLSYAEQSIPSDVETDLLLQFESWKTAMWICTLPGQIGKLRLLILQDWHLAVKDRLGQLLSTVCEVHLPFIIILLDFVTMKSFYRLNSFLNSHRHVIVICHLTCMCISLISKHCTKTIYQHIFSILYMHILTCLLLS